LQRKHLAVRIEERQRAGFSGIWVGAFFLNAPFAIAQGKPMTSAQFPISTAGMMPIHAFELKEQTAYAKAARMREIKGTVEWCL
jgi:hypothetical protein